VKSADQIRDEIVGSGNPCVFIDDTGSQGQRQNLAHMPDDRFSWVAVVVPPLQGANVFQQMDNCIQYIGEAFGADELHFNEIMSGKKAWKGIGLDQRLSVFQAFSHILTQEGFPLLNQTLWHGNDAIAKLASEFPRFDGKSVDNPKFCSLLLLLLKVRMFLRKKGWSNAHVVVDEGVQKAGSSMKLDGLAPLFHEGEVYFASSNTIQPLQLADFAAFSLNRSQVLTAKKDLKWADIMFLEAVQSFAHLYDGVELRSV
jgi:hypothetical protein